VPALAGAGIADHTAAGRIAQAPAAVENHPGRTPAARTVAAHTAPGLAAAGGSLGCIDPVGPHEMISAAEK